MNFHVPRTKQLFVGFVVSACTAIVSAQTAKPVTFEELCKYEKACQSLKDSTGFIKPKQKVLLLLNELRNPITEISAKLGVDPRAVAGAITAENTLNVQVDDDIQDWLVKMQITPTATILGKSFSIGLGQIHVEAAAEVESMIAKMENRKTRNSKEIAEALLTPGGAITYAAGIIRKSQDDYKARGIDVSKSPEILATLYNLGKSGSKAEAAQASKQKPKPNYFGFFVQQNLEEIAKAIEWKKPGDVSSTPVVAASAAINAPVESVGASQGSAPGLVLTTLRPVLTKSLQLVSYPPQCSTAGPGIYSEYSKAFSLQKSPSKVAAQGEYEVVSRGLDCEMASWILIRTKDGKVGWVDDKSLKAATEKKNVTGTLACDPTTDTACTEQISKLLGKSVIGTTSAKLVEVKLVGGKEKPGKVNLKKFNPMACFSKNQNMGGQAPSGGGARKNDGLTGDEADALGKTLEDKKAEIVKSLGIDKWDSPQNPFKSEIDQVVSFLRNGQCKQGCVGPVELVKELIKADWTQYKGLAGFKKFKGLSDGSIYFSPGQQQAVQKLPQREQWVALFKQLDESCAEVLKISKKSGPILKDVKAKFADAIKSNYAFTNEASNTNLKQTCDGLSKLLKKRAAKKAAANADPNLTMEAKTDSQCDNCQIQMTVPSRNGGSMSTTYSLELMEALLQKDQDFDDILAETLESFKNYIPSGNQSAASDVITCEYDPFESAKRVEAMLKLPCVESAYVPDMFILKKLDAFEGRVFHMPFVEDDRFAIRMKGTCEGVTK